MAKIPKVLRGIMGRDRERAPDAALVDRGIHTMPTPAKTATVPQHVKDQVDALLIHSAGVRQQLDILRQTRGQRQVGELVVPAHLRGGGEIIDTGGVEERGTVSSIVRGD